MSKKVPYVLLIASLLSFGIVAGTLIVMAYGSRDTSSVLSTIDLICGICFWMFLAIGIVCQISLSVWIHRWRSKQQKNNNAYNKPPNIGIFSFCKNPLGTASDIVFVISFIAFVVIYFYTGGISIFCYITLSLIFLSFCTHCILNGKNYYYITKFKTFEDKPKNNVEESI